MSSGKGRWPQVRAGSLFSLSILNFNVFSSFYINYLDGAGLFCGLVKYLLELGPRCPRTLIATHFHEVFRDEEELISPSALPISFVHMQVLLTSINGDICTEGDEEQGRAGIMLQQGESITYLYK